MQSLPGIWLFSKPVVRGKQYCEVGTIIRQKQEPNGCQSQLLDMKTLYVASLTAIFSVSAHGAVCQVCASWNRSKIIQLADLAPMIIKTTAQSGVNARQTEPPMQIPHT